MPEGRIRPVSRQPHEDPIGRIGVGIFHVVDLLLGRRDPHGVPAVFDRDSFGPRVRGDRGLVLAPVLQLPLVGAFLVVAALAIMVEVGRLAGRGAGAQEDGRATAASYDGRTASRTVAPW